MLVKMVRSRLSALMLPAGGLVVVVADVGRENGW